MFDRARLFNAGLLNARLLDWTRLELPWLLNSTRLFAWSRLELLALFLELLTLFDCTWLLDRARLRHGARFRLRLRLFNWPRLRRRSNRRRLRCWTHLLRTAAALVGVLHPILVVPHLVRRTIVSRPVQLLLLLLQLLLGLPLLLLLLLLLQLFQLLALLLQLLGVLLRRRNRRRV